VKSTTLVFLGLSVAAHGALFSFHGAPNTISTKGRQLQVSLLAGERQLTTTASRASDPGGSVSHSNIKTESVPTSSDTAGKSRNKASRYRDNSASEASISKLATTPLSGDRISRVIHHLLTAKFIYPPLALRQGYQGQVMVTVSIQADGEITDVTVAHSSGYRILDLAAVKSVQAIHRAPQLRQWLRGQTISINVPVIYRLVEA